MKKYATEEALREQEAQEAAHLSSDSESSMSDFSEDEAQDMELRVFSLFFTRKLVVYSYIFFSFSLEWIVFFFLSFIVERKKHSSYKIHPPNGLYYINDCDKSPNHPPPLAPPLSPLRLLKSHIPIIGEKNHFWNFCNRKRIIAKTFFLSQPSALSRFFRKEVKVHLKWRCLGQSENKCCRMRALSI